LEFEEGNGDVSATSYKITAGLLLLLSETAVQKRLAGLIPNHRWDTYEPKEELVEIETLTSARLTGV